VLKLVVALVVAVGEEAGTLASDVLDQGASEDDVQHLKPAADPEHRPVQCHSCAHQRGLVSVPYSVTGPLRADRGLAVALRRHIGASLEHEGIDSGEQVIRSNAARWGREQLGYRTASHQPMGERLLQVKEGLALEDRALGIGVKETGGDTDAEWIGHGLGVARSSYS
jgi:hypothetical protein